MLLPGSFSDTMAILGIYATISMGVCTMGRAPVRYEKSSANKISWSLEMMSDG